jgi:hypothetical protein
MYGTPNLSTWTDWRNPRFPPIAKLREIAIPRSSATVNGGWIFPAYCPNGSKEFDARKAVPFLIESNESDSKE